MADKIQISGLRELRSALRDIDAGLPKQIRTSFNEAAQLVIDDALPRVPTRSGRARGSIKTRSSQTSVRIAVGGRRAPYYPWLDFGGRVGPGRSVKRPFLREGRYIYASYYRKRDDVVAAAQAGLIDLIRRSGLEVT